MKVKKFILLCLVIFFTFLLASSFGQLYSKTFPSPMGFGGFIISLFWYYFFDGLPLSYIFFLSLLFTSFGGKNKYTWLGILLVPAVLFELYFDLAHIYVPIALGLVGWLVGMGVEKLVMGMQKK